MLDYYGNKSNCIFLGEVHGEDIEKKYQEISESIDKRPVASTILPAGTQGSFYAWIFFTTKENVDQAGNGVPDQSQQQQATEAPKKPKISMTL